jgi:hypothetical protein
VEHLRNGALQSRGPGYLLLEEKPGSRFCEAPLREELRAASRPGHGAVYPSLRRAHRRQRNRLDAGKVELARGMVDIEPDHVAIGVKIDIEPFDNLPRLRAGRAFELDIEAVRVRIIMQLHDGDEFLGGRFTWPKHLLRSLP